MNDSARTVVPTTPVHDLVSQHVGAIPDKIALSCEGVSITYAELEARTNQLARHLQSLGVERNSRVAICLERGLEMMVGLLAIMKAGGVYVALDPDYPELRLKDILADTSADVLLLQQQTFYIRYKIFMIAPNRICIRPCHSDPPRLLKPSKSGICTTTTL